MALHWNLTKIKNDEEIRLNEVQWAITHAIIYRTMSIGIREITQKNYQKFAQRSKVFEKIYGPTFRWRQPDDTYENVPITVFDIKRRIGLTTNASSMTDAQFIKNIGQVLLRDMERDAQREAEFVDELTTTFGEPTFEYEPEEAVA